MPKRPRSSRKPAPPRTRGGRPVSADLLGYLGLAAAILFLVVVRFHLLDIPLERDEGGFAAVAKAAASGRPLYTDLRDTKLPGLYLVYGLIMKLFGEDPAGIHSGLLVFNLATLILLFLLARRLFGAVTAGVSTLTYALLAVSPGVLGFATHAMQLLVLPGLGGVVLLWVGLERRRRAFLFLAGLLFGAAFSIKQPAVHYMLFGGILLLATRLRERPRRWGPAAADLAALTLGSVIPYLAVVLVMVLTGRFAAFWFWTVQWPAGYASGVTLSERLGYFTTTFGNLVRGQTLLWILAAAGLALTLLRRQEPGRRLFLVLFLGFMLAAVCTGFHFYPHYFVILLAPVALATGRFVAESGEWLHRRFRLPGAVAVPLLVFALAWAQAVRAWPEYYTNPDGPRVLRTLYGGNPFPESVPIGQWIRERREPGDSMVVFGSEPQLYLYADCVPATGHFFMYPLVDGGADDSRLQDEMLGEVEAARPRFLVFVTASSSWLGQGPEKHLFERIQAIIDAHYREVGVVDIFNDTTKYTWGTDAEGRAAQSSSAVFVFERRPA